LCVGFGLAGFAVRVYVAGHVLKGSSGRNTREQIADELNTTGLYSVVRHPLYVGNYLMWLGIVLLVHQWALVAIVTLAFWLFYERVILVEEDWLREKHGESFLRWARTTPAVIPSFRNWTPPAHAFSIRSAMRREYSTVHAFVTAFVAVKIVTDWIATGRFRPDPVALGAYGATLAAYLLLRTLKRRTRVLEVAQR
jgi:hypothetical protein